MADSDKPADSHQDLQRFAARLRELRASKGWTQTELAKRAGVSARAVAQWENEEREPSWIKVLALCRALEVDCMAFVEGAGIPEREGPGRPRKQPPPADQAEPETPAEEAKPKPKPKRK